MGIREKKGATHIEFILSTIIFISFVVIALWFFNPSKSTSAVESSLSYIRDEVLGNSSIEIDSYSVVLDAGVTGTNIGIEINNADSGKKASAIDTKGDVLPTNREGNNIYFVRKSLDDRFFEIRLGEDFVESSIRAKLLTPDIDYQIASSSSRTVLSEKRLADLAKLHKEDYPALKEDFNIPANVDFSFILIFSENDKIPSEEITIPEGLDVFTQTKKIEVFRNGDSVFADLYIKAW